MSTTCNWTIDDFLRVPVVEDPTGIEAVAFVILPQERQHESGFRMMSLVLIGKDGLPVGRVDCGSDVIALNGIGGGGEDWLAREQPPLTAMLLLQLSPTAIPTDEFPTEIDVDL